jgi:hypothetical protein
MLLSSFLRIGTPALPLTHALRLHSTSRTSSLTLVTLQHTCVKPFPSSYFYISYILSIHTHIHIQGGRRIHTCYTQQRTNTRNTRNTRSIHAHLGRQYSSTRRRREGDKTPPLAPPPPAPRLRLPASRSCEVHHPSSFPTPPSSTHSLPPSLPPAHPLTHSLSLTLSLSLSLFLTHSLFLVFPPSLFFSLSLASSFCLCVSDRREGGEHTHTHTHARTHAHTHNSGDLHSRRGSRQEAP